MNKLSQKAEKYFFILYFIWFVLPILIFLSPLFIGMNDLTNEVTGEDYSKLLFVVFLIVILVISFITLFLLIWAKLVVKNYTYSFTENGFAKEYGVIYKKHVTIPYQQIQNVDIHRGILARIMGLSDLNIQTAGMTTTVHGFMSGRSEGRLPAIDHELAIKIQQDLVERSQKVRQSFS